MIEAIELIAALCFLMMGFSYLLHPAEWDKWLAHIEQRGKTGSLIIGCLNLVVGSVILAFHPVWSGIEVVLTIIGGVALLKAAVYLLFPAWLPNKLAAMPDNTLPLLRMSGILMIALSIVMFYIWYY